MTRTHATTQHGHLSRVAGACRRTAAHLVVDLAEGCRPLPFAAAANTQPSTQPNHALIGGGSWKRSDKYEPETAIT